MRPDLPNRLEPFTMLTKNTTPRETYNLSRLQEIDQQNFLILQPKMAVTANMDVIPTRCAETDEDCRERNKAQYQSAFRALTGIDLQAPDFEATYIKPAFAPSIHSAGKLKPHEYYRSQIEFKADGMVFSLPFEPEGINSSPSYGNVFHEGCRHQIHNMISVGGYLIRSSGIKKPITLNFSLGSGRVEIIDPLRLVEKENTYCDDFMGTGPDCVLLRATSH